MHQYLVGQGYWSYIKVAQENKLDRTNPEYSTWEQAASRVMYFLGHVSMTHAWLHSGSQNVERSLGEHQEEGRLIARE